MKTNDNKVLKNCELWGFDINDHLKFLFPNKENFYFVSKDLQKVKGKSILSSNITSMRLSFLRPILYREKASFFKSSKAKKN